MTPQELKNSILQLAIQGRLVEQRPEEGTGEELYQQIQTEKQALIKAGKIKKEKPLPEIAEDDIPFEIPESWKWVRLGDCTRISTGKKDANYATVDGQYDFFTCAKEPIKAPTFSFEGECLILPGNGANVGLSIYYSGRFEAYQRTYVIERIGEQLQFSYLKYAMDWRWAQYNADKMFGSAIPFIKLGNLQNYCFPLPPLTEQKRIVAKIEELLPLIERYEKAWSRLEEFNKRFPGDMQKSILQLAIQGRLVEQRPEEGTGEELYQQIQTEKQALIKAGKIKKEKPLPEITEDEVPFEIPESWKWCRLTDLAYLTSGKQYAEKLDGIPYLKVADMNLPDNQDEVTTSTRFADPLNDGLITSFSIIFPKRGGAISTNKKRIVIKQPVYIDSNSMGMTIVCPDTFNYIKKWFDSVDLGKLQSGTSVPQINNKDLSPLCIPLPPLAEQKRIVAKLEELLPLCERLK